MLTFTAVIAAAAALAAPAAPAGLFDGEVYTASTSRGSTVVVRNWYWPQYSRVTIASIPRADRVAVPPGRTAAQYGVPDADGVIARPECTTRVVQFDKVTGSTLAFTLAPGWAYKMPGNLRWTVSNTGVNCRG